MQAIGLGCEASHARELVYADGIDLENPDAVVPVGVTCRLCEHIDCEQRAFPPLQHPLKVDENVRGRFVLRAGREEVEERDERRRVLVQVDPVGPGWDCLGDGFSVEALIAVAAR